MIRTGDDVTVLTLEPLDFNLIGNSVVKAFRGEPCRGRQVIKVDYPASIGKRSIPKGVAALSALLHETAGRKLVMAHSQGAQVASRWLREYGTNADAPPADDVEFLLFGNPLRKYGGKAIGAKEVDGARGLPTLADTRYNVTDVKLQYDGWCDQPNGRKVGLLAKLNARRGQHRQHCFGYRDARLDDRDAKIYVEGRTTYLMLPSKPLLNFVAQNKIEKSYLRPER